MQCCCAEPEEPCSTACVTPQCNACVTKVVEATPCGTEATHAWISVYVIEGVDITRIAQNLLPNSVQKLCWLHLEEQQLYYIVYTKLSYTGPPMVILAKPPVKQQYSELSSCAAECANELHLLPALVPAMHAAIWLYGLPPCNIVDDIIESALSHAAAKGCRHLATAETLLLRLCAIMMSGQHHSEMCSPWELLSHQMSHQRCLSRAQRHTHVLCALLHRSHACPDRASPSESALCLYPISLHNHPCSMAAQLSCKLARTAQLHAFCGIAILECPVAR